MAVASRIAIRGLTEPGLQAGWHLPPRITKKHTGYAALTLLLRWRAIVLQSWNRAACIAFSVQRGIAA